VGNRSGEAKRLENEVSRRQTLNGHIREGIVATNTGTVKTFFNYFNPANASYLPNSGDIATFMKTCFVPDAGTTPPSTPSVGIGANVDPKGPQFYGYNAVYAFFEALITSFPNIEYDLVGPLCYSSADATNIDANPAIIVPAMLNAGALQAVWLPVDRISKPHQQFYSKPLSDLEVEPDKTKRKTSTRPSCPVFTFQGNLISTLAIYMDRWQMAVDLWRGTGGSPRSFPNP
jgi:hypothetical protein